MKRVLNCRFLILIFISVFVFESCSSDDSDIVSNDSQAVDNNNDNNNDNDNDQDQNGGDQNGGQQSQEIEGSITLYRVEGNNIVKERDFNVTGKLKELQDDVAKHRALWEFTKNIAPESYIRKLSQFMIFAGENNGTAGYVFNTENDLSKWQMGLAIDFAYSGGSLNSDGEFAYTVIHEFGHIVTLDNTQVDGNIGNEACPNYFIQEGCTKLPSYINVMYQRHWSDIASEHAAIGDDQGKAQQFYDKHSDRFVTQYAATNPPEDIAEVFTRFVLDANRPGGTTVADQKVQLLYDYNELLQIRDHIRRNQQQTGRALKIKRWDIARANKKSKMGCLRHR
ncbi:hypothetical protein GTQ40_08850 [Flavobacteriaceae bacterium R38]|nr:hypothetical protein [Flavobacteriaceae bacterium R38]